MTVLTLYGKPGCHLCDDARATLHEVMEGRAAELVEVDVTLDPGLHNRYGERIPVLDVDGEELFEFFVDPGVLRERLDKLGA